MPIPRSLLDLVDARERQGEGRGLTRRQANRLYDAADAISYALNCPV